MRQATVRTILVGRESHRSKQWVAIIAGVFGLSLVLFSVGKSPHPPPIFELLWWEGFAGLLVGVVVLQAFSNDGLLLSWGLTFAAVAGALLNLVGIGLTGDPPTGLALLRLTVVGAGVAALSVGTIGFLVGAGARRVLPVAGQSDETGGETS